MPDITITTKEIEKIAELASLELSASEKEQLVHEFQEILDYFRKLDAVPLPDLQAHGADKPGNLRDDEPRPSGMTPADFSPYLDNAFFKVPKVIE